MKDPIVLLLRCCTLQILVLFALTNSLSAQTSSTAAEVIANWLNSNLHPLESPATASLDPLKEMLGNARIVGLGESLHSASEPMTFRNQLLRFLVVELDFSALVIESGLVESKALNDYVLHGIGDLDTAVAQGISHGFDQFQQNVELIRWLRQYNSAQSDAANKVQIFGMDTSGSPGNLGATRNPDTALAYTLQYLSEADPIAGAEFEQRIAEYLPAVAGTNGYGTLPIAERNALTAAIEDMISLISRREFAYTRQTSPYEYAWAKRAAISARQVDSWFRRMPENWVLADGLDWHAESQIIRDQIMADNVDWVLEQLPAGARIMVFAANGHMAATEWTNPSWFATPANSDNVSTPYGAYARARYGDDFVNIFNMLSAGEIYFCGAANPTPLEIGSAEAAWGESAFAAANTDEYLIDLRTAPPTAANWLQQTKDHRNFRLSTSDAFDIVYYIETIRSDCRTD